VRAGAAGVAAVGGAVGDGAEGGVAAALRGGLGEDGVAEALPPVAAGGEGVEGAGQALGVAAVLVAAVSREVLELPGEAVEVEHGGGRGPGKIAGRRRGGAVQAG